MIPDDLKKDSSVLHDRGYNYKIIENSAKIYIAFENFRLPSGIYNMQKTNLLIFTNSNYPYAGFDMFWTDEKLTLKDGRIPKQAEMIESHLGKRMRRFSYHPYEIKKWNPSEDTVSIFIEYVQQRLRKGD